LGYDQEIVSATNQMINVLYLTNNAGRASTTVATRGWLQNLMPRGLHPVVVSPVGGEFQEWVESQGGTFCRFPARPGRGRSHDRSGRFDASSAAIESM
jgi:hypothetical protein